jgi:hypothetical protein
MAESADAQSRTFRISLFYEDFPCALRAMEMCLPSLVRYADAPVDFRTSPWKIDWMHDAEFQRKAEADVAASKMIVISWQAIQNFSHTFRSWLARALTKSSECRVISIINCGERAPRVPTFFKELAQNLGVEILSNTSDLAPAQRVAVPIPAYDDWRERPLDAACMPSRAHFNFGRS